LSEMEEKMFAANTNLKRLYIARELGKISTQFAESNRFPTISLGTGASFSENVFWQSGTNPFTMEKFGSDFSNNFNYYLNGTISYRLYDAGARKRNIQNAKMEEEIAAWNIDDLKRNLSNQLATTLANYQNQVRLVQITENLINNAQKNINIAKERFDGGQISSFDYRSIQLAYLNANQAKLSAIFNLKNTEIELTRLVGGLVR
ncbi:MAG: TolC family protein, partial [Saprospiraceae bacterium]